MAQRLTDSDWRIWSCETKDSARCPRIRRDCFGIPPVPESRALVWRWKRCRRPSDFPCRRTILWRQWYHKHVKSWKSFPNCCGRSAEARESPATTCVECNTVRTRLSPFSFHQKVEFHGSLFLFTCCWALHRVCLCRGSGSTAGIWYDKSVQW